MPFILPQVAAKIIAHHETSYFFGATTVLFDPSGAACIPGGLWPCGLSAGAPPDCVLIGPVQLCGCNWPLSSGAVRPPAIGAWLGLG
jgi:hypothetical protein